MAEPGLVEEGEVAQLDHDDDYGYKKHSHTYSENIVEKKKKVYYYSYNVCAQHAFFPFFVCFVTMLCVYVFFSFLLLVDKGTNLFLSPNSFPIYSLVLSEGWLS